ncbi:hypothetical protein B0H17DRAFT_1336947 [Mycena rosella]|uniref:Apple domain-containing protein n=1 Tax=Mycena rosella TaxID=1033263 RepID=A0AAD7G741_MYCRO|nr:hypothetical protein B0H17DRAFT_1336947 [Mycena rosella]
MPSPSRLFALAALFVSASATYYTGEFHNVFNGTAAGVADAAIEDNANYLTYTLVSNATYSVAACQDWCKSNLVCAAYKAVEPVSKKTGYGGQTLYSKVGDTPAPTTYRTQSSGWALDKIDYTDTPAGYTKVFGPTNGANNAPGYMGYTALGSYDIAACAALCNARPQTAPAATARSTSGFTCSFYYIAATAATAVNYGQGKLVVTLSRGYARVNTPAYTLPLPRRQLAFAGTV